VVVVGAVVACGTVTGEVTGGVAGVTPDTVGVERPAVVVDAGVVHVPVE
jgi:hypothetical protein